MNCILHFGCFKVFPLLVSFLLFFFFYFFHLIWFIPPYFSTIATVHSALTHDIWKKAARCLQPPIHQFTHKTHDQIHHNSESFFLPDGHILHPDLEYFIKFFIGVYLSARPVFLSFGPVRPLVLLQFLIVPFSLCVIRLWS